MSNLEALYQHMATNGIPYDDVIECDGKIHRFSKDHKHNKRDEWYVAYDGISTKGKHYLIVIYGSWSDGSKFIFKSWENTENIFDKEEREALQVSWKKKKEKADRVIAEVKNQVALEAQEIWKNNSEIPPSSEYQKYAAIKKINPVGIRYGNNPQGFPSMILPLHNIQGNIQSLQFISVTEDGSIYKAFLSGGNKKGNFMVLGTITNGDPIQVAEGYSTACSCYSAMKKTTVVAFDCGNINPVVKQLRQTFPGSEIVICADNDTHTANNPGRTTALQVAAQYNCKIAIPLFPDACNNKKLTDFNDLMQEVDINEVKTQIASAKIPLKIYLDDISNDTTNIQLRKPIYQLAYQAKSSNNFPQKDIILNQLHEILKSQGISKHSINHEFKEYLKECNLEQITNNLREASDNTDQKVIDDMTKKLGDPIIESEKGHKSINQLFFANKYAHEKLIVYELNENSFYQYKAETGVWGWESEHSVKVDLGDSFFNLITLLGHRELLIQRTDNVLKQILNLLKGGVGGDNIFQNQQHIIHAGNGLLRLKEDLDIIHPFRPDYYSRNRSEIIIDPKAECQRFLEKLVQPAVSEDDIELLQKYCGQCLLGKNLSQTILLISGTPGGGKSCLVSIIEKIISLHNVAQLKISLLSEKFETASFVGKTLLTGKDVPSNFLNHNKGASVLKSLVGGDRLSTEQKNAKKRIEIRGEFNILITSNARLHLRLDSDTGAWRRRLLIIAFENSPPEIPIANFDDILIKEEGSGILNWMIEGAVKLLDDLEVYGRIQRSDDQINHVESLLSESDSIRAFILQCTQSEHGADVTVHALTEAYMEFCNCKGWQAEHVRSFETQIRNIMLEVYRSNRRNDIMRNGKSQKGFKHISLNMDILESNNG